MDAIQPARKIPPSKRSNTGYIPSMKVSSGTANYESRLERDFYLLLNHDPSILQFQPQPETISWTEPGSKQTREYTPDVLVISEQGKHFLFEMKYESDMEENLPSYCNKWTAAAEAAKKRSWEFGIVTEKMIRTPRLYNVWFSLGSSRANFSDIKKGIDILEGLVKGCQDGIEYRHLCSELARELGIPLDRAASHAL